MLQRHGHLAPQVRHNRARRGVLAAGCMAPDVRLYDAIAGQDATLHSALSWGGEEAGLTCVVAGSWS